MSQLLTVSPADARRSIPDVPESSHWTAETELCEACSSVSAQPRKGGKAWRIAIFQSDRMKLPT